MPSTVITGVGDVFTMRMYFAPLGGYEMLNRVVVYEKDRRIAWEPGRRLMTERARRG